MPHPAQQIFVNLPVENLKRSVDFFTQLGFSFNPKFTDENATCMIVGDNIFVMLLVEKYFLNFTKKAIADTKNCTEALFALAVENRDAVTAMVTKAIQAGATTPMPAQDHGFMLQHGFEGLDGHLWEVFFMDPNADPHASTGAA